MLSLPSPAVQVNSAFAGYVEAIQAKNPEWSDDQCVEYIKAWAAKISGETTDDTVSAGLTESERSFVTEDEKAIDKLASLTADTLDPKDMLKKYVRLGNEALRIARKRRASFKAWSKDDFESLCAELERKVKLRVAIANVEMAKYVRIALWVEATKVAVPTVDQMSYYQAYNKFAPTTLQFDAVALTGEIRKDWIVWNTDTVNRQLGTEPLSIKALDESIRVQRESIESAKRSKQDPEKALLREQKAADSKIRKERESAQSKIADAIDKAIIGDQATAADVMQIAEKVMESHGVKLPKPVLDMGMWAVCTKDDVKTLADVLFSSGKFVEMRFLRDRLDAMIKITENSQPAANVA